MTIRELLQRIAETDALPRKWRVQAQKEWFLEGATEPTVRDSSVLEYWDDEGGRRVFGRIETSEPLRYTQDWIEKIVVDRETPASVVLPLQVALRSNAGLLELEPSPEIPF